MNPDATGTSSLHYLTFISVSTQKGFADLDDFFILFESVKESMHNMAEPDKLALMSKEKNEFVGWFRGKAKNGKIVWIKGKEFVNTLFLLSALVDFSITPFSYEEFFKRVLLHYQKDGFPEMSLLYLYMFGGVLATKVSHASNVLKIPKHRLTIIHTTNRIFVPTKKWSGPYTTTDTYTQR